MKKIFVFTLLGCLLLGSMSFAKTEYASTDAAPVVLYGQNSTTTIVPIKVSSEGMLYSSFAPYAQKITQPDNNTTYFAQAAVGSAQSSAVWQAYKMAVSGTTTTITWADGNANFDNVATDLTALTYS